MTRNYPFKEGHDPVIGVNVIKNDADNTEPKNLFYSFFVCNNCLSEDALNADDYIDFLNRNYEPLGKNATKVHASDTINYRSNLFGEDEGHQGKHSKGLSCEFCNKSISPVNPKMN